MREISVETKKLFDEIESKRPGTALGIPRNEGEELHHFIKEHNIKRVIETGICSGFTSWYILSALPTDGKLYSIEKDTGGRTGEIVPQHLRNKWEWITGSSKDKLLKCLECNRDIDFFFHDSDHTKDNQLFEYKTAHPFIKYIGSHDITLYGAPSAWQEMKDKGLIKIILELGQLGLGMPSIPN